MTTKIESLETIVSHVTQIVNLSKLKKNIIENISESNEVDREPEELADQVDLLMTLTMRKMAIANRAGRVM